MRVSVLVEVLYVNAIHAPTLGCRERLPLICGVQQAYWSVLDEEEEGRPGEGARQPEAEKQEGRNEVVGQLPAGGLAAQRHAAET